MNTELDTLIANLNQFRTAAVGPLGISGNEPVVCSIDNLIAAIAYFSIWGSVHIDNNATPTVLTTQSVVYPINVGWNAGDFNNTILDTVNGTITIQTPGEYQITSGVSFTSPAAPNTLTFVQLLNGVPITTNKASTWTSSPTLPNHINIVGIVSLNKGDVISLGVKCATAAGISITAIHANISLFTV
jgi:hypothetical protein